MRHLSFALLIPAALMTGCSMAGTGDYFADTYAPLQDAQYGCGGNCAPDNSYPVAQPGNGHAGHHGVQTPDAHAYGQSVQGHRGYHAPAYAAGPHGLRGMHKVKQSYAYGDLGVVNYEAGEELLGIQGRLGYQTASVFGAELEGSLGLSSVNDNVVIGPDTFDTDLKVRNSIAGFALARVPVSQKLNLISRVGYHKTSLGLDIVDTVTGAEGEADFSTDGFAYGMGAEYALSPRTSIRADYTVYDYDGPDADAISLAIARKF